MRWKLLVLASFAAALLSCGLWSALAIGGFGSAAALARNEWLLLSSPIIPLAISIYSGVFVYRHTARRRKTQATVTVILALVFTLVVYEACWVLFPDRFHIPTTYDVRHSR